MPFIRADSCRRPSPVRCRRCTPILRTADTVWRSHSPRVCWTRADDVDPMPRFSLSEDNVFAIEIKAALLAAYTLEFGIPMCALIEPFSTMVLPEFSSVVSAFIRKKGPQFVRHRCRSRWSHVIVVYCGSSSPTCSATMYAAYQSGQFASRCPVRSSCSPWAASARRSALARSFADAKVIVAGSMRPGSRVVIS